MTTADRQPGRAEVAARPLRVLVVDDEAGPRLVLARALARSGHQVFSASSGADALERLAELSAVDAVVSDISMPTMTGIELGVEILERYPGLPILFVSSVVPPDDLLANPRVALLTKPVRVGELRTCLEALVHRAAAPLGSGMAG